MKNDKKLSYFLNQAKIIKTDEKNKKTRVAVLGSFSLNGFDETIRVKCYEKQIECKTYIGDYNQYNQDILKSDSKFYQFNPEITFLILDVRHIIGELFFTPYSLSLSEKEKLVNQKIAEINNLIITIINNSKSHVILTELQIPTYSPYGINEKKEQLGLKQMIQKINEGIRDKTKKEQLVSILDFNEFIQRNGENNVFNYKQFFSGDIKISIEFIPKFIDELLKFIIAILGMTKKCIVLDLDNTLWGGIIGEDGFDGIELGHTSNGKAFVDFQKELLSLWNQGIILAINSKNNPDDAMKVLQEHPDMILRKNNFASIQTNWNDKAQNLKQIADEINIGLSSIVFFDDDKLNRERIKQEFPEVLTVELPDDPSQFSSILKNLNDFNVLQRTEEDIKRGQMYVQQRERKELEKSISSLDDFLEQLHIQVKMKKSNEFLIPRISQLTLKTNQFNLTTKRYQEEEIKNLSNDSKFSVGCAQVLDKFGDNGITGVYIVSKNEKTWFIDTFLLSCRIMGRGVENAMLSEILKEAKENGVENIKAEYIPTEKNMPAENFLSDYGFKKDGNFWFYNLNNEIKSPNHLKVEIEK